MLRQIGGVAAMWQIRETHMASSILFAEMGPPSTPVEPQTLADLARHVNFCGADVYFKSLSECMSLALLILTTADKLS